VEPDAFLVAEGADLVQRVDRARAHGSRRADGEERRRSLRPVLCDQLAESGNEQPLIVVRLDPTDRVGAQAEEVGRLLDPRVRLGRAVHTQRAVLARGHAVRAHVPRRAGPAGGKEADEVGHVAAADQQAAAVGRVAE
jgi:hypothetical protein